MKKVCATGPGSARPVVSMTTRSKSSSPLRFFSARSASVVAQVLADGAADAAVVHLDDLLLGVLDEDLVVDVLLAELVLDHGDLLAVRLGEHALEQRRLARAEEAGEDGGGDQAHGRVTSVVGIGAAARRPRARACHIGAERRPFKVAVPVKDRASALR